MRDCYELPEFHKSPSALRTKETERDGKDVDWAIPIPVIFHSIQRKLSMFPGEKMSNIYCDISMMKYHLLSCQSRFHRQIVSPDKPQVYFSYSIGQFKVSSLWLSRKEKYSP